MAYPVTWRIDASGNLVVERQTEEAPRDIEEACEALTTNDSYEWLAPEDIGALTDAWIIGRDVVRDDSGELVSVGAVFWYPQYETVNPVAELMERGRIVFTLAPDAPDDADGEA